MYCHLSLKTCPKISLFFFLLSSFSCLKFFLYLFLKMKLFPKCTRAGEVVLEGFREQQSIFGEDSLWHTKSCFGRNGVGCGAKTRLLLPPLCQGKLLLTSAEVWLLFPSFFCKNIHPFAKVIQKKCFLSRSIII